MLRCKSPESLLSENLSSGIDFITYKNRIPRYSFPTPRDFLGPGGLARKNDWAFSFRIFNLVQELWILDGQIHDIQLCYIIMHKSSEIYIEGNVSDVASALTHPPWSFTCSLIIFPSLIMKGLNSDMIINFNLPYVQKMLAFSLSLSRETSSKFRVFWFKGDWFLGWRI